MPKETGLYRRGNFCRAAGFCTVAHHTGNVGNGIDYSILNHFQRVAAQVGNARRTAAGGAYRAAVSGKLADKGFLEQRYQIAQSQGAQDFLPGQPLLLGKDDYGKGYCHALIAAAGVDDHRQDTPAHPGIGTGGRIGGSTVGQRISGGQQGFTDLSTPLSPQALLCNGHIVIQLLFQNRFDFGKIHGFGKPIDVFDAQITVALFTARWRRAAACHTGDYHAVPFLTDNICVGVPYFHQSAVSVAADLQQNVQIGRAFQRQDFAHSGIPQLTHMFHLLRLDVAQYLHAKLRISGQSAQNGAGIDTAQTVGSRDNDAFDVFDDVSAAMYCHGRGHTTEQTPGAGGCIGNGNGFCAAQRGNQFPTEQSHILRG